MLPRKEMTTACSPPSKFFEANMRKLLAFVQGVWEMVISFLDWLGPFHVQSDYRDIEFGNRQTNHPIMSGGVTRS